MDYEWDPTKNINNIRKHKVGFDTPTETNGNECRAARMKVSVRFRFHTFHGFPIPSINKLAIV